MSNCTINVQGMSNRVEDEIKKIIEYLDSGNIEQAEESLAELEEADISQDYSSELNLIRANYYIETKQPQKAKEIVNTLITKLDNFPTRLKIRILSTEARILVNLSEFLKAEQRLSQANNLFSGISEAGISNLKEIEADLLNLQGLIEASKGEYHTSISNFENASMLFRKQNRIRQRAIALFNQGHILSMMGRYDRSIAIFEEAAKLFKDLNLYSNLSSVYDNLIQLYETKNDRDNVYTYKQLKQDLKDKLEFERYRNKVMKEKDLLHSELNKAKNKIDELKKEIFNLKFQLDSKVSTETNNSMTKRLDEEKIKNFDSIVKENKNLKNQIANLQLEIEELEKEKEAYEYELNQIVETKQNLAQEKVKTEILTTDKEELIGNIRELEKQNQQLQSQVAGLHQETDGTGNDEISDLERTISKQEKVINELENKNKEVQDKLNTIEKERDYSTQQLEQAKKEISQLQHAVQQAEQDGKVSNFGKTEIQRLQSEIEEVQEINKKLQIRLEKTEKQNTSLNEQLRAQEKEISRAELLRSMEPSSEDLEKKVEKQRKEILRYRNTIDQLRKENQKLRNQVEIKETTSSLQSKTPTPQKGNPMIAGSDVTGPKLGKNMQLENIFAENKLAKNIYERVKELKSIKLRLLAMQFGVSSTRALEAVNQLVEMEVVNYDESLSEPVVSIKE